MSTLERAVVIAAEAHRGAVDKGGHPYILHPLRVMMVMTTADERVVAVLHDVIEDTPWTLDGLRDEGFSEEVLSALDALTKRDAEDYLDFVRRASRNPLARRVKFADVRDNMDLSRIPSPTARDRERITRYEAALRLLEAASE